MKKIIIAVLVFSLSNISHVGIHSLTIHSRANCGNNESITWHKGHSYYLLTVADHLYWNNYIHSIGTGWEYTWRSAAIHWGEGNGPSHWHVQAGHYIKDCEDCAPRLIGFTATDNCDIYDGW